MYTYREFDDLFTIWVWRVLQQYEDSKSNTFCTTTWKGKVAYNCDMICLLSYTEMHQDPIVYPVYKQYKMFLFSL